MKGFWFLTYKCRLTRIQMHLYLITARDMVPRVSHSYFVLFLGGPEYPKSSSESSSSLLRVASEERFSQSDPIFAEHLDWHSSGWLPSTCAGLKRERGETRRKPVLT